jgi:tartronate-semialdehyde synthase
VKELPRLRERLARPWDFNQTPIKPQRIFKEIDEFFDEDTVFVTCIGLNQIWSSQYQRTFKPRHYLMPGGAGPLGWDLPAAIGAKIARPDLQVVQVVGDYGLGFCGEQMAMACMYNLPMVIVVINNGYLSLIRQAEKYTYNMNFEVSTWYDERRVDFVKWAQSYGAYAERVEEPGDIKAAFRRAVDAKRPALVEIVVEREADASMGPSLDQIREFEPLPLEYPARVGR